MNPIEVRDMTIFKVKFEDNDPRVEWLREQDMLVRIDYYWLETLMTFEDDDDATAYSLRFNEYPNNTMRDICIRFNNSNSYSNYVNNEDYKMYVDWIKKNIPKTNYFIPRNMPNYVYFLDEDDLTAFTLKFGKVYKRGVPSGPSKVEKMIMHEEALERSRREVQNKET
jgi:hypothetical protein